jgi:hypothetical protein
VGNVVQFKYGADGLDPAAMEGHDKPVDLNRILLDVTVFYCALPSMNHLMHCFCMCRQDTPVEVSHVFLQHKSKTLHLRSYHHKFILAAVRSSEKI